MQLKKNKKNFNANTKTIQTTSLLRFAQPSSGYNCLIPKIINCSVRDDKLSVITTTGIFNNILKNWTVKTRTTKFLQKCMLSTVMLSKHYMQQLPMKQHNLAQGNKNLV